MLARRLLIAFLSVIAPSTFLLGAVTAYSIRSLDRLNHELVKVVESREAVAELRQTFTRLWNPLGAYVHDRDPRNREKFEALVRDAEEQLRSCAEGSCHVSTQAPERMAEALRPGLEGIKTQGRLIFQSGPRLGASHAEAVDKSIDGLRDAVERMVMAVRPTVYRLEESVESVEHRALLLAGLLTLGISVAGSAVALLIARRIARPLSDLVHGTRRVKGGDWTYQARVEDGGEIGELASSFNVMVEEIRQQRQQLEEQNRTLEARVRRRTETLRQKEQALVQSEKLASLGRLAAGVAHELNNPLTSIVMNVNLLREEVDEGSQLHHDLTRIDADAGRCRRIIEDLRSFARLRQLEKVSGGVGAVVEQAVSLAAHELSRRQVQVQRDLAPDLPSISWDPGRMVQVLSNLLVNSAQAIGDRGRIVIRGRRANGWLSLEVEDDGPGIPSAHRSRVFDPFFTTKPDGTGLGLSISHGIVNEHGGRIEVESQTGEEAGAAARSGTTVRVILPLAEAST